MEISFESKNFRDLCARKNRAKIQLGEFTALKLISLLADLDALNNVEDLLAMGVHNLEITNGKIIRIKLTDNFKVIFSANHLKIPLLANGIVNWSEVTRIKILNK